MVRFFVLLLFKSWKAVCQKSNCCLPNTHRLKKILFFFSLHSQIFKDTTILWRADVLRLIQDLNDGAAAGITVWNSHLAGSSRYRQACKDAGLPRPEWQDEVRPEFLPGGLTWGPHLEWRWQCANNWHPGNVLTSRLSQMLLNHICQ